MENNNFDEIGSEQSGVLTPVQNVTRFSKYFALTLFIILPFVGGYVGYELGKKDGRLAEKAAWQALSTPDVTADASSSQTNDMRWSNIEGLVLKGDDFVLVEAPERTTPFGFFEGKESYNCSNPAFILAIGKTRYEKMLDTINRYEDCTAYNYNDEYFVLALPNAPKVALASLAKNINTELRFLANKPDFRVPEILDTNIFFDYENQGYLFTYDVITDTRLKLDIEVPIFLADCRKMNCNLGKIYTSPTYSNTYFFEIRDFGHMNIYNKEEDYPLDTYFFPLVLPPELMN